MLVLYIAYYLNKLLIILYYMVTCFEKIILVRLPSVEYYESNLILFIICRKTFYPIHLLFKTPPPYLMLVYHTNWIILIALYLKTLWLVFVVIIVLYVLFPTKLMWIVNNTILSYFRQTKAMMKVIAVMMTMMFVVGRATYNACFN